MLKVDPSSPSEAALRRAAEKIREGGLVAFPTETVYGLGANALSAAAVRKIYEAKGRPPDNPIIVHIASLKELEELAETTEEAKRLAARFWPGPLTLVLKSKGKVPPEVTAGLDSVAVRMPAHNVALGLIRLSGVPIAAPSANISGRPSPTRAEHVIADLGDRIDIIIDGGETLYGVESTVVSLIHGEPMLLRPGAFPKEEIEAAIGRPVAVPPFARGLGEADRALAPGTRHLHYAPRIPLILVEADDYGDLGRLAAAIASLAEEQRKKGKRVAVLATEETAPLYEDPAGVIVLGSRRDPFSIAKRLFDSLRRVELVADVAIAEGVEERGLGLTIMNRLRKASSKIIKLSA